METAQYKTPYEKYVREGIDAEKKNLDDLYNEFAKSNSMNKQIVKRKIDESIQNIELLQRELEKYGAGLSWLREPSKDRDEKAEHLEKIQEEPQKPASHLHSAETCCGHFKTFGGNTGWCKTFCWYSGETPDWCSSRRPQNHGWYSKNELKPEDLKSERQSPWKKRTKKVPKISFSQNNNCTNALRHTTRI